MNEAVRAAVYGHLVGGAIGVPYEFRPSHRNPLLSVGFDPEDQGRRALAWADATAYTPDGDGAFDIGNTRPPAE